MATSNINFFNQTTSGSSLIGGPLDVQGIVEQIIKAKKASLTSSLTDYQTLYNARKQSYQELNRKVSALESSIYNIRNAFNNKAVSLSDSNYLSASASSQASEGTFSIIIAQLAQAQSNSSTAFESASEQVLNDGATFKITQGSTEKTIAISGQTRSLNGLKNAINSLGLDLTATVIFDGSKYRLQVTGKKTGTENGFTIDDSGVGTNMSTPTKEARNAEIYVNTPVAEEYKISRSTNTINDVISGVTLNLKAADQSKTIELEVKQDSTAVKEKVKEFISRFNEAVTYLNAQFEYNKEKESAGPLSGEAAARQIQFQLLTKVSKRISGIAADAEIKSISNIGLTLTREGLLELNESKFQAALESDFRGVQRVFYDLGVADNPDLAYIGKTSSTKAGQYQINITRLAEKAEVQASYPFPESGLAQNETLTFTYQGQQFVIELETGKTISEVVSALNDFFAQNSMALSATNSGNYLRISSNEYGSSQKFSVFSSVEAENNGTGIGTELIEAVGVDVAGTIGGSAAKGSGQVLTSLDGDSKGLSIFAGVSTLGEAGTVYLTFSPLEELRQTMFDISLPYQGLIAKNIDALDQQLENIDQKLADITSQLAKEADLLISQFTKANEALVQLQYLQSSLNNSASIWKS